MPPQGSWSLHCEHKGRLCITMDTVGLPFCSPVPQPGLLHSTSPAPRPPLLHLGLAISGSDNRPGLSEVFVPYCSAVIFPIQHRPSFSSRHFVRKMGQSPRACGGWARAGLLLPIDSQCFASCLSVCCRTRGAVFGFG